MASAALRSSYARDGFVALPAVLRADEVQALTGETVAVAGDDVLAIHFPHKLSTLFRSTRRHPAIVAVLTELIGPDVKAMQSMLFVKPSGKPGQAWHQDEYFLPTRDRSLCGVWIALDDATVANGCLWAHPGSHAPGILYPMRPHGEDRFDASEEAQVFLINVRAGCRSSWQLGASFFSTAICCTDRCPIPPHRARGARWLFTI